VATERQVVEHLRQTLRADAAILVGSRADGTAREQSDWDCYALIDDGTGPRGPSPAPAIIDGARIDAGVVHLPVASTDVLRIFGPNLQDARVLFDTDARAAQAIVDAAASIYAHGRKLTGAERTMRAEQMARNIATMVSRGDEPGPFFEALTFIFYTAHRNWYEVLHDSFSKSVHRAMPEIAAQDPAFHTELLALASSMPKERKLSAARALYARLFGAEDGV